MSGLAESHVPFIGDLFAVVAAQLHILLINHAEAGGNILHIGYTVGINAPDHLFDSIGDLHLLFLGHLKSADLDKCGRWRHERDLIDVFTGKVLIAYFHDALFPELLTVEVSADQHMAAQFIEPQQSGNLKYALYGNVVDYSTILNGRDHKFFMIAVFLFHNYKPKIAFNNA